MFATVGRGLPTHFRSLESNQSLQTGFGSSMNAHRSAYLHQSQSQSVSDSLTETVSSAHSHTPHPTLTKGGAGVRLNTASFRAVRPSSRTYLSAAQRFAKIKLPDAANADYAHADPVKVKQQKSYHLNVAKSWI